MDANGGLLLPFKHGFFALTPALRHNIALFFRLAPRHKTDRGKTDMTPITFIK